MKRLPRTPDQPTCPYCKISMTLVRKVKSKSVGDHELWVCSWCKMHAKVNDKGITYNTNYNSNWR